LSITATGVTAHRRRHGTIRSEPQKIYTYDKLIRAVDGQALPALTVDEYKLLLLLSLTDQLSAESGPGGSRSDNTNDTQAPRPVPGR
jgi:hypothetical protein